MPTQVPLFGPTRELRFSAADIAAIRAAEGAQEPVVELHGPRASFAVIFRRAMIAYLAVILLIAGRSRLGELQNSIETYFAQPSAQLTSEVPQAQEQNDIFVGSSPRPAFAVAVSSLSEIEAELNTLPLRQPPAYPLLDDMVKVEPPAAAINDEPELSENGQQLPPRFEETEEWHPRLRRAGDHSSDGQPRSECQFVLQPETTRSHVRATKDANNERRGYQPNARHDNQTQKTKLKKPSRLRRALSGILSFEQFVLNQVDPMAGP